MFSITSLHSTQSYAKLRKATQSYAELRKASQSYAKLEGLSEAARRLVGTRLRGLVSGRGDEPKTGSVLGLNPHPWTKVRKRVSGRNLRAWMAVPAVIFKIPPCLHCSF